VGAGGGGDRLGPAAIVDRQLAELEQVHPARRVVRRRGGQAQVAEREDGDDDGQDEASVAIVHDITFFRRNPTRLIPKCTARPRMTIVQAIYGSSQPGLRTTWRIVPS